VLGKLADIGMWLCVTSSAAADPESNFIHSIEAQCAGMVLVVVVGARMRRRRQHSACRARAKRAGAGCNRCWASWQK
jgi:hypothetical protein